MTIESTFVEYSEQVSVVTMPTIIVVLFNRRKSTKQLNNATRKFWFLKPVTVISRARVYLLCYTSGHREISLQFIEQIH